MASNLECNAALVVVEDDRCLLAVNGGVRDEAGAHEGSWKKRSSKKPAALTVVVASVAALGGLALAVSVHQSLAAQNALLVTMQQQL